MIGVIRWVLHWWSSGTAAPRVCYTNVVGVIINLPETVGMHINPPETVGMITDTETSAVITE